MKVWECPCSIPPHRYIMFDDEGCWIEYVEEGKTVKWQFNKSLNAASLNVLKVYTDHDKVLADFTAWRLTHG